jgi:alpha-tubulin suppressor-like RCC1 family protein
MRRIPYARGVLATGTAHVSYVKPDGHVYSWGDNTWGELGNGGSGTSAIPQRASVFTGNVLQVAAGAHFELALTKTGAVYGFGRNDLGQVGLPGATKYTTPVQVISSGIRAIAAGYTHSMAIKDGRLYGWGTNSSSALCGATNGAQQPTPTLVGTGTKWMTVSAGDRYNMVIDSTGNLYSCGDNAFGQLGTGSTAASVATLTRVGAATDRWVAVSAGGAHVAAIKDDGTLWTWGDNFSGELGLNSRTSFSTPRQVTSTPGPWKAVSAGANHTVAIKADGSLWAWGLNNHFQLGIGAANTNDQLVPVRVGTMSNWEQISAGFFYTTGVSARGELYSWGLYAMAGNSTSADRPAPGLPVFTNAKPGVVVAGDDTSLEVRSNGSLYTWGDNTHGQLGLNSVGGFRTVPTPTNTVDWVSVAGGLQNNYGVKADGSLWAWGRNASGELGFGDQTRRQVPTRVSTAGWTRVSACDGHVFALRADGTMYAWGVNSLFALGDGTQTTRLAPVPIGAGLGLRWVAVACGNSHGIALASDGNSYSWGEGSTGVLGITPLGAYSKPTKSSTTGDYLAIGTHHRLSAALTAGGDLKAWGSAVVGDGTTAQRNTAVTIGAGFKYLDLTIGRGVGLARKGDGSVVGWGFNSHGELGDGTKTQRLAPTPSMFGPGRSLSLTRQTTLSLDSNGLRAGAGDSTLGQVGNGSSNADVIVPTQLAGNIFSY